MIKRFTTSIPIIRKDFDKTKSAKFKGELSIVSNEHGIIYDWKIKLTEVAIDLMTTKSWFPPQKNNMFKIRRLLFNELGFKQIGRPNRSSNLIKKMNSEQLEIINKFINDRGKYKTTVKNIVTLFKGNNPTGEAASYKSAEMIIDSSEPTKNFIILLDKLIMKNRIDYDAVVIGTKTIGYKDFFKLNPSLESAFNFMQRDKTEAEFSMYLSGIKEYYNMYNITIKEATKIASKARAKYSKNIDDKHEELPFGLRDSNEFTKCHIYEFHDLRDEIVKAIREKRGYDKYEKMIKDPDNFVPLPNEIHRKFDLNYFTYKLNGEMWAINELGFEYINKYVDEKYKKIPDFFMTPERKKYFDLRNKDINW